MAPRSTQLPPDTATTVGAELTAELLELPLEELDELPLEELDELPLEELDWLDVTALGAELLRSFSLELAA